MSFNIAKKSNYESQQVHSALIKQNRNDNGAVSSFDKVLTKTPHKDLHKNNHNYDDNHKRSLSVNVNGNSKIKCSKGSEKKELIKNQQYSADKKELSDVSDLSNNGIVLPFSQNAALTQQSDLYGQIKIANDQKNSIDQNIAFQNGRKELSVIAEPVNKNTPNTYSALFEGENNHSKSMELSKSDLFNKMLAVKTGQNGIDVNNLNTNTPLQVSNAVHHENQVGATWGPLPVVLTSAAEQAKTFIKPIREHIEFQIDHDIKSASVQLEPPKMGKVDLNIRLDGDRLYVQMHAVNNQVRDALLSGLDRLRNELSANHQGNVQLDVASGQSFQQSGENKQNQYASSNPIFTNAADSHSSGNLDNAHSEKLNAFGQINYLA